jgi:hypothetical protein
MIPEVEILSQEDLDNLDEEKNNFYHPSSSQVNARSIGTSSTGGRVRTIEQSHD